MRYCHTSILLLSISPSLRGLQKMTLILLSTGSQIGHSNLGLLQRKRIKCLRKYKKFREINIYWIKNCRSINEKCFKMLIYKKQIKTITTIPVNKFSIFVMTKPQGSHRFIYSEILTSFVFMWERSPFFSFILLLCFYRLNCRPISVFGVLHPGVILFTHHMFK